MNTVTVRGVTIGEGCPKVCVPIVEQTKADILKAASALHKLPVDVVEWRVDWFDEVEDQERVLETLAELREIMQNIPILVTFRTIQEGGECEISQADYFSLNKKIAQSHNADLVDIEMSTAGEQAEQFVKELHENTNIKVIMSSHNFSMTPSKDTIIEKLCKMQEVDADICKIAVMPKNTYDVLTLLTATAQMSERYADRPIVTMSMSSKGVISRIAGETFGSAMTFGAARKASAPGQLEVEDLDRILHILHRSC